MVKLQSMADKAAIGLSALCLIHCLALPLILIVFPSLFIAFFSDEVFHIAMLYGILPLSLFALLVGFRHHQNASVLVMGFAGLILLLAAILIGHDLLGEYGEVVLTVLGSVIIALSHIKNARLRQAAYS